MPSPRLINTKEAERADLFTRIRPASQRFEQRAIRARFIREAVTTVNLDAQSFRSDQVLKQSPAKPDGSAINLFAINIKIFCCGAQDHA
jgi:hypothetical protein